MHIHEVLVGIDAVADIEVGKTKYELAIKASDQVCL